MTGGEQRIKKEPSRGENKYSFGKSCFSLQMKKNKRGAAVVVGGIAAVASLCDEEICLLSHGGRLTVRGEGLKLLTLENRTLEVFGKITELNF